MFHPGNSKFHLELNSIHYQQFLLLPPINLLIIDMELYFVFDKYRQFHITERVSIPFYSGKLFLHNTATSVVRQDVLFLSCFFRIQTHIQIVYSQASSSSKRGSLRIIVMFLPDQCTTTWTEKVSSGSTFSSQGRWYINLRVIFPTLTASKRRVCIPGAPINLESG